ncbi:TonB-dependent siderophore receptor [Thiobacillus sp.]|uniref:TonB-dependent receptor plug domain-containing protein n=1 Tax=Thiobacillus sp. TaxID=924 RepID=UPI0025E3107B|nr:TonB-dependent receptor [Thiobacillus sp.]
MTESDFLDDLPVVLSASRLSQPVSEAPVAVTVIDQEMIHASGFRDIPDLLRLVPGFSVHYGAVNWTDLPLSIDDIERIEVVRGPDAAIYGANAFAAVINIITKTAAQVPGEFVSLQLGEQGMRGATVRHGGGDGALRYRLTVSTQQRDRFERDITNKIADGAGDNGQYFEASKTAFVNGRMDWQLSANSDAMAQFGLSQGDWSAGRRVVSPTAVLEPQQQDARAMYLQLAYHKVESARREWRLQAYYAQNRFDANAQADLTALGIGAMNVDQYLLQTRSNIELQVNEQWRPNLRGVWGGEVRQETVTSPQNYNSGRQWSGELARVFGNLEWRPHERVLLQGGAMLEHHYFTGIDISPRVAANFTLTPGHVIRLGISRAYRSPTFFEEQGNQVYVLQSGAVADVVTVPSDGLAPERVLSREIAYVGFWRPARLEMDVRLFQDKIDDFIGQDKHDFDPSDDGGIRPNEFKYANIGSARSHGGELQLRWRPVHALDLSAHYSRVFLEAHFGGTGIYNVINFNKDVPVSAPRNTWGLLASYRLDHGWEANMGVWRSDAMKWLSEGDLTAAYNRMDLRVARRWKWQGRDIEASVVGQSLFGNYQEFRDTNIFSRRVYGSLSLGW